MTWAFILGCTLACSPPVSAAEIGTIIELEVSPSGRQFAVISLNPEEEFDENTTPASHLWLVDAVSRRVLSVPELLGMVTSVSFVPGEDKILYALLTPDDTAVIKEYEPATDVSHTVAVARHWNVINLQCAPNGKRFGYVDNRNRALVIVDLRAGGSTKVVAEGKYHWHWCWSADGESVFYIDGMRRSVWKQHVNDPDQSTQLFVGAQSQDPCLILASPNGTSIGFEAGDGFYTIELATSEIAKRFSADHYFAGYSWNRSGICYLDKVGDDRERRANLMVYDFGSERRVATGVFAYARWISADEIVVRQGGNEVWKYHVKNLKGERLFPLP